MTEVIISSLVSLVLGIGSTILFYPQTRREKNLQNEAKQSEEWKKLYDEERSVRAEDHKEWEADRLRMDTKIDELYALITKHRDEKAAINKEKAEMAIELTRLKMLKCEVVNCPNRKPPTGY